MFDYKDIILVAIAILPYIALFLYLLITKKLSQFPSSMLFYGVLSILLAAGAGVIGFVLIISQFAQTTSNFSESSFNWILAVTLLIICLVGELFRYFILKDSKGNEPKSPLAGLAFGAGFSVGMCLFTLFGAFFIIQPTFKIGLMFSVYAAIHIVIQLAVSVPCFELIKNNNYACIAVGALYYLSVFMMSLLSASLALNIAAQIIILAISIALFFTFLPSNKSEE